MFARPGLCGMGIGRLGLVAASQPSLVAQALAILAKYGSAANLYLPGVGAISGITAGNWLDGAGTTAATVDNQVGLVVNARGGANLTQPTTANKPILRRGLANQLLWSRDATQASWSKTALSIIASAIVAPDGSLAQKIVEDSTSGTHRLQQIVTVPPSLQTIATVLKAGERSRTQVTVYDGSSGTTRANALFDLFSGSVVSTTAGAPSIAPLGDGWYLCAISTLVAISEGSNNAHCWVYPAVGTYVNYAGDGTSGILINRSALFNGAVTAQQIIEAGGIPITTTAPASSTSGPFSWRFDGSNDSFESTLTTGNEGWVCAGVGLTTSAPANQTIFYSGADVDANAGIWLAVAGSQARFRIGDGIGRNALFAATVPIGSVFVLDAGWGGAFVTCATNGVESTLTKTRNPTSTRTIKVGGIVWPMSGTIGDTVIMPTVLPTSTERATLRQFIASLSGVTM